MPLLSWLFIISVIEINLWDFPRPAQKENVPIEEHWEYKIFKKFEKEHPGVRINFTRLSWKNGQEKLDIAVLSGHPPDICGSGFKTAYVEAGALEPLDTLFASKIKDFYPYALKPFIKNGHLYAIPWYATIYCILVNKTLTDSLGISLPEDGIWDFDTFVETARSLTDPNKRRWGFSFTVEPNHEEAWPFLYRHGFRVFDSNNQPDFLTGAFEHGVRDLLNFIYSNKISPEETGGLTQHDTWVMFINNRTGMTVQGTWAITALIRENKKRIERGKKPIYFQVMNFPTTPDGIVLTGSPGIGNWVIFKQKDKEKLKLIKELIEEILKRENQKYLLYMGTIPVIRSAGDIYKGTELEPYFKNLRPALENVVTRPFVKNWEQIDDLIARNLQLILLKKKDITTVVTELQEKVKQLISEQKVQSTGKFVFLGILALPIFFIFWGLSRFKPSRWDLYVYLLLSPILLVFLTFTFLPVVFSFLLSFFKYKAFVGFKELQFVGLEHYYNTLKDPVFIKAISNTIIYTAVTVPWSVALALFIAILLYPFGEKIRSIFKASYYLPGVVSAVVISVIWRWMFDPSYGLLNQILSLVHLPPQPWLTRPETAMKSIILTDILTMPGTGIIIYLAALDRIPSTIVEAARVDGAYGIRLWGKIIIPLLAPTTLFLLVIRTISSFQVFTKIYILTKGGPGYATNTVVYSIFRTAFSQLDFSTASAQAFLLFVAIMAFSWIQFKFFKEEIEY